MAFKNFLAKVRPHGTAEYRFDTLPGCPVVTVRFGGKGTPGWRSDEVKLAAAHRQRGGGGALTERVLDEGLLDTAKLIAKHCVVSWENMLEDDGKTALCTPAKAEEFLVTLIEFRDDLFIDFARFVRNAENFVDEPPVSGVELGKP